MNTITVNRYAGIPLLVSAPDPHEAYYAPFRKGGSTPRIGPESSLMENILELFHAPLARLAYRISPDQPPQTAEVAHHYYHLNNQGLPDEPIYWLIRLALLTPQTLTDLRCQARAHAYRWLLNGDMQIDRIEEQLPQLLDRYLKDQKLALCREWSSFVKLPHPNQLDAGKISKVHQYMIDEADRFDRVFNAMLALLSSKPTTKEGALESLRIMNELRLSIGLPSIIRIDKITKRLVHKTKQAIVRGASLLRSLGHSDALSQFVKGDSVRVSHTDSPFVYEFTRKPDMPLDGMFVYGKYCMSAIHNHAAFMFAGNLDCKVLSKAGESLFNLCIYMDATPVLDQLTSFMMHIESGEEAVLLDRANFVAIVPTGRQTAISALVKHFPKFLEKYVIAADPGQCLVTAKHETSTSQESTIPHFQFDREPLFDKADPLITPVLDSWFYPLITAASLTIPYAENAHTLFGVDSEQLKLLRLYGTRPLIERYVQ